MRFMHTYSSYYWWPLIIAGATLSYHLYTRRILLLHNSKCLEVTHQGRAQGIPPRVTPSVLSSIAA